MERITKTIDNSITLDTMHYGQSIGEWSSLVGKLFAEQNGWDYDENKGTYGYHNMVFSIAAFFEDYPYSSIDEAANSIHEGWIKNYTIWRDLTDIKPPYQKPCKSIGDERRELCAKTSFYTLPENEKEKDIEIAKILLDQLEKCVTNGERVKNR